MGDGWGFLDWEDREWSRFYLIFALNAFLSVG